tara:strand:- start:1264 stop:1548 length:285 start_codon:yes stop_codon:yes gene_type:complete
MLVELVEVKKKTEGQYALEKIYLNPKHIVYIREDRLIQTIVREGKANLGLVKGATFSKIRINHNDNMNEITVVGDPSAIEHKIFKNSKRQILRG